MAGPGETLVASQAQSLTSQSSGSGRVLQREQQVILSQTQRCANDVGLSCETWRSLLPLSKVRQD
jgi:hypothetical protein